MIKKNSTAGFSFFELLIVFGVSMILLVVTMPNFLRFISYQRLNSSNTDVFMALRSAQDNAMRNKQTWQASFRMNGTQSQWAVHRTGATPSWQNLETNIGIDGVNTTTGNTTIGNDTVNGWRFMRFNFSGTVDSGMGRITLRLNDPTTDPARRCSIVDTLIGGMRVEKDQGCN